MKENKTEEKSLENVFKKTWGYSMDDCIMFWRKWTSASGYQKDVFENYCGVLLDAGHLHPFFQLVPTKLFQEINPWSFSLIQFTREIKGSPEMESKILTDVAGYGSQLGTMMDFLDILGDKIYPDKKSRHLNDDDELKYLKFKDLSERIKKVKGKQ